MRLTLCAFALLAAVIALGEGSEGTYRAPGSVPAKWRINEHHALIWDEQPYLPVGVRTVGDPDRITALATAGVKDVIVQLPVSGAGWHSSLQALEAANMRYLLAIDSVAPMAKGIVVEPQGYRIEGITAPTKFATHIPGATSVLAVLATRRDGAIQWSRRVATPEGRVAIDINPMNTLEHVLLLYPQTTSLEQPDFWDSFDGHRDALLAAIKAYPPGKGLRGIVNPVGAIVRLPGLESRFVPTSPYFQMEFRSYLESKYRSLQTTMRSWAMGSNDLESMGQLARLVPLWSGQRGVGFLWDPATDALYACEMRKSNIWRDLQDVLNQAATRRYQRIVSIVRNQVDVPVIQEWAGWSTPYEAGNAALDGIGARSAGSTPSAIAETAGRAVSTVFRWKKPGWLLATRIDLAGVENAAASAPLVVEDLASMGVKGWFFADSPTALAAMSQALGVRSEAMAFESPRPLYFPESAANPARSQRLPGGRWWLPSPAPGNRIDYGSLFAGYRIEDSNPYYALWTTAEPMRVRIRFADPTKPKFESIDGTDPAPRVGRNFVDVNIGQVPLLITNTDEIPVPEVALEETVMRFETLLKQPVNLNGEIGDDRMYFNDAITGFDRNPGGSFATMRLILERLSARLADFVWLEGEASRSTNFSEVLAISGCSRGSALHLRSQLADSTFFAEFNAPGKVSEDQEIWIAARMSPEMRASVRVLVGGQILSIKEGPIETYGAGFGWYRLGRTKIASIGTRIRLEVVSVDGADFAFDALLVAPERVRPNGIFLPDAMDFPPTPVKPIR